MKELIILKKRLNTISYIVCVSMMLLFSRCAFLVVNKYNKAGITNSTKSVTVSETRGNIYDCNMQKLVNYKEKNVGIINPTGKSLNVLRNRLTSKEYKEIRDSFAQGNPEKIVLGKKKLLCDDIAEITVFDRYENNDFLRHIIGYTDMNGDGVSGIEESFDSILKGTNRIVTARYTVDARGMVLMGINPKIEKGSYYDKDGVQLTIDRNIQKICEAAADEYKIKKGAVVVLDTDNFKIRAMVSRPVYDLNNLEKSLNDENSPFINRALCAYSTGSVFKLVVSAAALEENINDDYDCAGKIKVGDTEFYCANHKSHGYISLKDAIAKSCNTFFINLSRKISAEKIINTAASLGFGERIRLCEGIVSENGNLPAVGDIKYDGDLANLSFGQGSLMSTPLQVAAMTAAIANSGYYVHPTLIEGTVDKSGNVKKCVNEAPSKVLSDSTTDILKDCMEETLISGTAEGYMPLNTTACAKTSTAESSGNQSNSWFAGFFPKENPKYAVVILKENGTSGGLDCGPVFKRIAEKITLNIEIK